MKYIGKNFLYRMKFKKKKKNNYFAVSIKKAFLVSSLYNLKGALSFILVLMASIGLTLTEFCDCVALM